MCGHNGLKEVDVVFLDILFCLGDVDEVSKVFGLRANTYTCVSGLFVKNGDLSLFGCASNGDLDGSTFTAI